MSGELKVIEGGGQRRRPPGRTEVLVRAELELKFVVRRVVKTEGGGEENAWERDGEAVRVTVGESTPVLPALENGRDALFDAALELIPDYAEEDEDRILRTVTAAVEDTLLSVVAKGEL